MANSNIDAKSTLIAAMEARAVETCNVFCEQTKQFSELKTLFENLSLELESYKSKVQDLTEKNECVPSYIKEISELKELVKRSQEETNTEVESVDLLKLSQLENSLADTKVELANCLQQLAQKDERIRKEFELRSLCEGDNLRIKDDLVNLKTTFENERNILLNDFNTKSSQVDKLTKDLSDSIIQFSSISQINDELQKNIDKVTNDKITVIEGMQQAIKEMERSLQQVTESRDTFKDEYTKIESDKLHLETILNEKSEKISELSILTSTLANEIDNLKLSMNANYQALAQKDEEIASLKMTDENRSTCIEELNQIISQSGQLQKDNQLVITELNALKLENISLGEKLSALQVNLKDQQDCIGKLTDENISLKTEFNQAVSQSSQLQQGNELLTAEINSLKAENLSLSENLSLLHISLKDQLENVGSLTNEKLSLKTELNQAVSRSSQLQQGSELLTAEFNFLKAENLSLSENFSLLQISLEDQLENVGSLTNENLSLKTELNQISQSSLENELLTSDLNALRTDNLALNEHANSLQEQLESINKLNEDNSSLKNELNDSIENNKTACAQILVLESGINRIKEDLLNSAKKVESLQSQLEQEMSCRHTTDSHLQSILEELTSIAEYLQEDKYYSTYSITEFSNSSDILQSENSNIMKICKTLASLREHLMAMETLNDEFSELRARQTYNEEFYQSELYKLKGIIDNLNVDLVKSKLNEQGSLESLMNNSISNKENLFKQIESLTPMRKKREEFSSLDCQNITPSYLTSTKKENILPGRTKTPSKNKYEIKKVLDLIINEVISTEVPLKMTTFTPEIPELNIIIHKLGELKMALKASLESNIVLRENIMQLETSNNDLRTILKNTCVTIKELENIQVKYTDSDVTFSSGMIDEYMDLLQRRVMDIISLKTVIQQNLLLEENESTDVVKVTECSASNISAGENRLTEDLSMVKDENEVEIFAFDEISASKVETLDTQQLECLINVLYSKLENAFSLLEIEGNFIQNPEDLHYSETQIEKQMLNLINMHKSLIDELKHTLSVKNHRIQTLEIEISANENDVRELAKAAEELQKKVMCQRSASEVSYAEYSLLNSHYTTVLHRHSRAHSAYVSTTKYMQSRLSNLENVLQNLSLTEDQTMHETTLDDFVTPKKHSDSVYDVVTFNETPKTSRTTVDRSQYVDSEDNCTKTDDQKRMYDDLQSQLNDKCLEIKRLSEKLTGLDSLKLRYQELQLEYDSVSNELIESLQEADSSKDKFISLQKDCMDVIKKSINRDISDEQCDLISLINLYISEVSHQNDKYIKELNLLEDSVKSLKSELHAKEDLIVEYQSKSICNTDFDLKLSSLQGELVTKDSEISNLLTNILELKSSIVDISQQLEVSQTENTQIIQQKEILEKKIADFITSESVLKESELLLQQKYEHLAANNSSAQSLIQAYQVEKNDLLSTIKSLEEKCYNESKNSDLLSSNSEKLASLQEELNSRVSDIEALQNTLNTKNSSLVSLTEKCEELSKTLSEKNIELEANQKEFDNRLQLLQQELEDATSQKISLKEEMDSLKREVRSSTDLITQLKEELQVKSDLLLASNSERHNLVAKETIISQNLDELNQKYVDLQTNSQKQEEALKELLNSQHIVSELQSELVKVKDEKSQLSNQIKQLENQIQTYTLQITKSQEALKVSNDDLNTATHKYNMLTQSTNDLKNEYDNLNKVLNDYRINSEKNEQSLKREVELLQECINQNQINLKEYERRLSESDLLIKKGDSLLETVSLKYESEMAKCEALEKEINDFSVEMKIKEEERCSLLSNTAQLSNMLNEKDQELHTKMEEISQLKTLSRTSASLQFENEKLTMEIKNQAEHIRDLQSKVVSLENSAKIVRELEEKISNLSSHNYILENRVVDLQSELTSSKYNPRHDLHVRRQSLHDLQRCLPQAASPLVSLDDNNDVSMKECDSSEDVAQLKECASRLETQLASLNERYSQLEQVSLQTDVKLKQKTDEYNKISSAYQSIEKKLEELTKINESLSNKPKVDPTVNPDFKGVPMSLFVDKMTHEILAEKFRSLQKSSESLRSRNLEQSAELRRLQHSLQNNTMHNLLPKDGCKPYEKLQEELRIVEQEFRQLKEKEKERDDWEAKYKEIDTEYDACVLELKDAVANYNTVCEEKLRVEAELKHLKNKLEEMSEGSPGMEIRRKRQTLHDANRKNNLSTSDKSTNTDYDKSQEKYKPSKELHLQHFSTLDSLKSNEMSKRLEQELKILKEACRRQEDWEDKYKEMDKEYTVCADELRDSVRNYNTVCEEKLQVEAELKHLKNKMEEMKEGSPSAEVRRRRQSLFDTNRGTNLVTSDKTTNTEESNEHSRIQRCNHCEHTRPSLPENRCVEAEARLRVPVAIPPILHMPLIPGPGFIQNQKLHEYMQENEILKRSLSKYKGFYIKYRNHKKPPE